jgi:hypothetical protein
MRRNTTGSTAGAMLDLIERKLRLHTDRLYEERGHAEGCELEDWLKAASEVLQTTVLAPSGVFRTLMTASRSTPAPPRPLGIRIQTKPNKARSAHLPPGLYASFPTRLSFFIVDLCARGSVG